ncbi:dihydroxyacetone kinase phosphoryl donor subunit DhaM [Pseudactinotalea suaedae]|uniref:dihydroxyacetone kinase phosphoryl donor subunit DhaM n=1 Tax=Pseudactinotalea suaedae TaxID=1524924 RepID=UPI0012E236C3|nr:dihydroxyacetone kinase phosphoryl donor subunit DhaM [Pseudactinotalea suaedae]
MAIALVLVSHSAQLAAGVVEVAGQMAPDVSITPAGGTEDGRVGTSYDLVEQAVSGALADGAEGVVILTDLGSATLTAESVLEVLDDDRVRLVEAPFVEAAVASAVSAQGGGDLDAVIRAARTAVASFAAPAGDDDGAPPAAADPAGAGARSRTLVLANSLGLHARPAAVVARKASEFDADVTINGVDAASVLALMALGLVGGAEVELSASGPQADAALEAIAADIEAGFGED